MTRVVTHYRAPFYEKVRDALEAVGSSLVVVYGAEDASERDRSQTVEVAWGHRVRTRYISLAGRRAVWLHAGPEVRGADLVVLDQQARQIFTTLYLMKSRRPAVALWAHGKSDHVGVLRAGKWLKRLQASRADWLFGYTDTVFTFADECGFPRERITIVENATDTSAIVAGVVRNDRRARARIELFGFEPSNVGLFLGSMYVDKRLEFLVEALDHIRSGDPSFAFVAVGAGESQSILQDAAETRPWLRLLGHKRGSELGSIACLADVLLLPGLVGLPLLDGFALGIPTVTITSAGHSPEIAYLRSGSNGLILPAATTAARYAESVLELLRDRGRLEGMRRECLNSAARLTVDNMVSRFEAGLNSAVRMGRR